MSEKIEMVCVVGGLVVALVGVAVLMLGLGSGNMALFWVGTALALLGVSVLKLAKPIAAALREQP